MTMKNHDRYIQRTIDIASTSTYRWQLGSLIVNNGNVLSWATNKFRNPPSLNHLHATTHAEMAALRQCLCAAKGGTIYVARVNRLGESRLARPCDACLNGLTLAGIRRIIYTTNDGTYQFERL
ncbi:MAG: hypothetical protein ABR585_13600 [Gemmatimonadaceae bacterium]